jgi:hypothetical protein
MPKSGWRAGDTGRTKAADTRPVRDEQRFAQGNSPYGRRSWLGRSRDLRPCARTGTTRVGHPHHDLVTCRRRIGPILERQRHPDGPQHRGAHDASLATRGTAPRQASASDRESSPHPCRRRMTVL